MEAPTKYILLTPTAHQKLAILKAELNLKNQSELINRLVDYYRENSYLVESSDQDNTRG